MKNTLPEKYKNSFFVRIRRFFSSAFGKKQVVTEEKIVEKTVQAPVSNKENVFETMKKGSQQVAIKEDILTMVDKNPQLINTLSLANLKELDKMYDDIIEKNNLEIRKLERMLSAQWFYIFIKLKEEKLWKII